MALDGGRYHFADTEHALALTEPEAGNEIHGLTRWANWTVVEHSDDHLVLRHTLHAQTRWPFVLDCELDYRLDESGLTVHTSTTNVGSQACPYATGAHPYLTVGTEWIDAALVQVPGSLYYPTDHCGVPTGDGLLILQPGERHDAEWGIEVFSHTHSRVAMKVGAAS